MIIGISGKLGSGKDTLADLIVEHFIFSRHNATGTGLWQKKSFAAKLKQTSALITGMLLESQYTQDGKNLPIPNLGLTVGEFQQLLGTEVGRSIHPDIWVHALFSDYKLHYNWVVSDVRFINEADYITQRDGILIRINGDPANIRANSKRDMGHTSETSLDNYKGFNFVIDNDGSKEDLKNKIQPIIDKVYETETHQQG